MSYIGYSRSGSSNTERLNSGEPALGLVFLDYQGRREKGNRISQLSVPWHLK